MERVKLTPSLLSSLAVAQAHREHKGRITSIDFDSTGRYCLTSAEDDAMCLYDADVGRFVKLINSKKYGVDLARFLHRSTNVLYASTKNDGSVTRPVAWRTQQARSFTKARPPSPPWTALPLHCRRAAVHVAARQQLHPLLSRAHGTV